MTNVSGGTIAPPSHPADSPLKLSADNPEQLANWIKATTCRADIPVGSTVVSIKLWNQCFVIGTRSDQLAVLFFTRDHGADEDVKEYARDLAEKGQTFVSVQGEEPCLQWTRSGTPAATTTPDAG